MSLDQEIESKRAEIRSDGYPMSIGELINIYRDGELDIHPEFQRFYRWNDHQKSRLIESILLGIPLPSIFVSQREDGVWDVIDGLQRLATIFQLVGHLKDEKGNPVDPLMLKGTKYLPSLEGRIWEAEDPSLSIGSTNQLIIRRSKIDVKVILRESSESTKYELFQRLNTGGSFLSEQEVRNVILIMVNREAYQWVRDLADDDNFQTCVALSDRQRSEQYHLELVVRFLVFRNLEEQELRAMGDIGDFLTDRIVKMAECDTFQEIKAEEEHAFRFTFETLAKSLSDSSFRRFDQDKGRYLGGFLISAFEPLAIGLGHHYSFYADGSKDPNLVQVSKSLWSDTTFLANIGMGVRASSRITTTIPLGRNLFGT
jgi:hypothetical protein